MLHPVPIDVFSAWNKCKLDLHFALKLNETFIYAAEKVLFTDEVEMESNNGIVCMIFAKGEVPHGKQHTVATIYNSFNSMQNVLFTFDFLKWNISEDSNSA